MTEATRSAAVLTTGRPLDDDGRPNAGPALELDRDGPAAALLRESPRALAASPGADLWATLLERPGEGETERPVLAQWLETDAPATPTHYHPASETFEVVSGTLTVEVDGERRRLGPGESVTVEAGVEHSFRNDTDGVVAFRAELPSMRTVASLYTAWGLDAEAALGEGEADGQPAPLDALALAAEVYPDTVTTVAPAPLQRVLWATVGRAARALGRGIDDRYLDDGFWERRVEQPDGASGPERQNQ
ncbi:cupin domain-containing protein [Halosimplex litoreum]|uniref:Cupin domain-containing protein n=1 Tax=Halosimplex litoreum TaxID=1198301 RepID=A0A7T3FVJ4_9EURY|nr:cupin domain-containing protein [Halosimplex litoreum]QPV61490.1 cupin domain-containing protein [Halosimplex litoreum]